MASQWFWQDGNGHERGPVDFHALAQLIREQQLREVSLVRNSQDPNWQRVDAVIGLTRAAGKSPAEERSEQSAADSEDVIADAGANRDRKMPIAGRLLLLNAVLVGLVLLGHYLFTSVTTFPKPDHVRQGGMWNLPLYGLASTLEVIVIVVDVLLAGGGIVLGVRQLVRTDSQSR